MDIEYIVSYIYEVNKWKIPQKPWKNIGASVYQQKALLVFCFKVKIIII